MFDNLVSTSCRLHCGLCVNFDNFLRGLDWLLAGVVYNIYPLRLIRKRLGGPHYLWIIKGIEKFQKLVVCHAASLLLLFIF